MIFETVLLYLSSSPLINSIIQNESDDENSSNADNAEETKTTAAKPTLKRTGSKLTGTMTVGKKIRNEMKNLSAIIHNARYVKYNKRRERASRIWKHCS